jgi:hypothetical protein
VPKAEYAGFEALDPFFEIVQKGLSGLVDGEHYFDTIDDDALFEFRYNFPGFPSESRTSQSYCQLLQLWQEHPASFRRLTCRPPLPG